MEDPMTVADTGVDAPVPLLAPPDTWEPASATALTVAVPVPSRTAEESEPSRQAQPPPTAAAFTEQRMLRPAPPAPAAGWRRAVYRLTAGTVNPGPSPAEAAAARLVERVRRPIDGSRRIAVVSRKGGVGKTSVTLLLGHALAAHRGDRVVALDGNPDAGSLGHRVVRETAATVTDLLAATDRLAGYSDVRRFTSQAPSRLEVVASDDDPAVTRALDDGDYAAAIEALDRHYNLLLCDTGTGILDAATQGILAEADQLVVVLPPSLDGARVAAATLDWLDAHGYAALVAGAVAALNNVRAGRSDVDLSQVAGHFAARCRAVVAVPFDAQLAAGGNTDLARLRPSTRDAYLRLAAAVADGFAQPPQRRSTASSRPLNSATRERTLA